MCHPEPLAKDLSKSDDGRTIPEILEFLFVATARYSLQVASAPTLIATFVSLRMNCVKNQINYA